MPVTGARPPQPYEVDWGGPSVVGVVAVHCLPGIIAAALMIWGARRFRPRTVR
jgi:hypothetical protein